MSVDECNALCSRNVDFDSSRQRQNRSSRNVDLEKNGKEARWIMSNEDVLRKINESRNMLNVIIMAMEM